MTCTFVVFRILRPSRGAESIGAVLGHNGRPLAFEDERAATAAADRMNDRNCRVGADFCTNVEFVPGWIGERQ